MSSLGYYHPVVVHFAVALLPLGVLFRLLWLALRKRAAFAGPAAAAILLLGAAAAVLAVKTGHDGHGPVEHMPGAPPLGDHQTFGTWTRNVFLGVAALELAALALAWRRKERPALLAAALSGALGVAGTACVVKAGKTGGVIVYNHAGGVGLRSGDPKDVDRLLLAGLFYEAKTERTAGKKAQAAELLELAGRRFPDDPEVRLLAAESLLIDRGDAAAAVTALRKLDEPDAAKGLRFRRRLLTAQALEATGQRDEALGVLRLMEEDYPGSGVVQQRKAALEKAGSLQPAAPPK
jgi:uncharacterized membrane protein